MIYLNNAATSFPKPKEVLESVNNYLSSPPFLGARGGNNHFDSIVDETRNKLKELLNADDYKKIVFTSGATESLNIAINSLNLENSRVVATNSEHNSVNRPLKILERDKNLELVFVNALPNGLYDLNDFDKALTNETKAVFLNHCSNVTGLVLNIEPICKIARERNIKIIIDLSQSIGAYPIDLNILSPDFAAFTSHKALFGLQGSGGLYIKEPESASPLKYGGTGSRSDYLYQPEEFPSKFESGTQNIPSIIALNAGLDFINQIGLKEICVKKKKILNYIISELNNINRIKIIGDIIYPKRVSTLSFIVDGFEPSEVSMILEENFNIKTRAGLHCAPLIHKSLGTPLGTVRISPSIFTTESEIELFLTAITQIAKS